MISYFNKNSWDSTCNIVLHYYVNIAFYFTSYYTYAYINGMLLFCCIKIDSSHFTTISNCINSNTKSKLHLFMANTLFYSSICIVHLTKALSSVLFITQPPPQPTLLSLLVTGLIRHPTSSAIFWWNIKKNLINYLFDFFTDAYKTTQSPTTSPTYTHFYDEHIILH